MSGCKITMITFVWRALGKPPTQPARPPPSQWHPAPPRQPFLSPYQHHRHQLRHFNLLLDYLHDLNDAFVSYLVLLVVGQLQVSLLDKQCLSATIPPNSLTSSTIPWETSTAFLSRTWSILWSGECPKIWGAKCLDGKCTRTFHPIPRHNSGKLVQFWRYLIVVWYSSADYIQYIPNIKEQQIHSFIYFQNISFRLAKESSKRKSNMAIPPLLHPSLESQAALILLSEMASQLAKMHDLPLWWAKHTWPILTISL